MKHTRALLVYGWDVPRETFEMLSVQLHFLLGELDGSMARAESARFDWQTLNRSYRRYHVLIAPDRVPEGSTAGATSRILERVRRRISVLNGRAVPPPGYTRLALQHLEWIASAIVGDAPKIAALEISSFAHPMS